MSYPCHGEQLCVLNSLKSSCNLVLSIRVENSVHPDQMTSSKPADMDLQCFQKQINLGPPGLKSGLVSDKYPPIRTVFSHSAIQKVVQS